MRPPSFSLAQYKRETACPPAPPLSLAYLSAVLKKDYHDVKASDTFFKSMDEAASIIRKEKPDILGLTSSTDHRASMFELAKSAREFNPGMKIVAGGPHVSVMHEQALGNYPVDIAVVGEGESSFPRVAQALEQNAPLDNIDGIVFKSSGGITKTRTGSYIENLDSIPFPDWSGFDFDSYPKDPLLDRFAKTDKFLKGLNPAYIVASRGCPFNCNFCTVSSVWSTKWRSRSAANIAGEIEMLAGKYGRKYLRFVDDTFTMNPQKTIELCKEIIKRNIHIYWDCTTRVNLVSEELLGFMKKAGCYLIQYGVESGSVEVLEKAHKGISKEQVIKAFGLTRQAGIKTNAFLMAGNPGDSEKTFSETKELLKVICPDSVQAASTIVFPGTALYEYCKKQGFIDDGYWLSSRPAPFCTLERSFSELQKWVNELSFPYMTLKERIFYILSLLRDAAATITGIHVSTRGISRYRS